MLLKVFDLVNIFTFILFLRRSRYLYLGLMFSSVSISFSIWNGSVLLSLITSREETWISESPRKILGFINEASRFLKRPEIEI